MRDVSRALEDLAEIHASIAAREVYRGWRSIPVAASGLIGLVCGLTLPGTLPAGLGGATPAWQFVGVWLAIAMVALGTGCAEIAWRYARTASTFERRRTNVVMRQFLPSLVAGVVIAVALVRTDPASVVLVPGVWALAFALGVFSARPCLPAVSVVVAAYYGAAGLLLLSRATAWAGDVPPPWSVGVIFGVGQLLAAAVIYVALERAPKDGHVDQEA
jgi:hypothetical protein